MSLSTYFYEPFHEPFFTASDLNHLFNAAWNESRAPSASREVQRNERPHSPLRPRMDIHESKENNEMTATFELPGLKKEDVSIDVHNNRLVVSGQSSISSAFEKEGYAVRERRFGKFSRTLPLPSGIKSEDIKAKMEDGLLTIRFPRSNPASDNGPKSITIN
ncbi:HSP20-like chaperone [Ramaria rubella]|nr:HSP20-like chaperone [Ramaria rubella]